MTEAFPSWLAGHGEAKRVAEYCEARIRTCKQNAARTGSEEATDLCRVFPVIKSLQKTTTLKDQRPTPLKQLIKKAFEEVHKDGRLSLKSLLIWWHACHPSYPRLAQ
jgi:hypothetical protein